MKRDADLLLSQGAAAPVAGGDYGGSNGAPANRSDNQFYRPINGREKNTMTKKRGMAKTIELLQEELAQMHLANNALQHQRNDAEQKSHAEALVAANWKRAATAAAAISHDWKLQAEEALRRVAELEAKKDELDDELVKAASSVGLAWPPIKTAPKTGEDVLVWRDGFRVVVASWTAPMYWELTDKECEEMGEAAEEYNWWAASVHSAEVMKGDDAPTHWMPVPDGPGALEWKEAVLQDWKSRAIKAESKIVALEDKINALEDAVSSLENEKHDALGGLRGATEVNT